MHFLLPDSDNDCEPVEDINKLQQQRLPVGYSYENQFPVEEFIVNSKRNS